MKKPIVIVGAGFSGAVLAERFANVLNKKVIVIEKRDYVGGNCYDFIDGNDLLVPKHGPHFFHTNSKLVWKYLSQFTNWRSYQHHVLSRIDDKYVPIPINIESINLLFGLKIKNKPQMNKWLKKNTIVILHPKNSEELALARFGKSVYEKLLYNYTKKQWGLYPKELSPLVMDRIQLRLNFDKRYFTDKYQAMPKNGYHKLFVKILSHPNIKVMLNTDYFKIKEKLSFEKLFYTGTIDEFFNYKFGHLQYRSTNFEFQTVNQVFFQPTAVVNYPGKKYRFIRITEPKHATGQRSKITTIIKEYLSWDGSLDYPVPTTRNQRIQKKYTTEANRLKKIGIYFIGRLANYEYINMDQAVKNSLDLFNKLKML